MLHCMGWGITPPPRVQNLGRDGPLPRVPPCTVRASDGPDPARRRALTAALCGRFPGAVPDPPAPMGDYGIPSLYSMGDSHVMSTCWRTVDVLSDAPLPLPPAPGGAAVGAVTPGARLLVPRVVTGLQGFHMREGTQFLTHTNLGVGLKVRLWHALRPQQLHLSCGARVASSRSRCRRWGAARCCPSCSTRARSTSVTAFRARRRRESTGGACARVGGCCPCQFGVRTRCGILSSRVAGIVWFAGRRKWEITAVALPPRSLAEGVCSTVAEYVRALRWLSDIAGVRFLVAPVKPPANPALTERRLMVALWNAVSSFLRVRLQVAWVTAHSSEK